MAGYISSRCLMLNALRSRGGGILTTTTRGGGLVAGRRDYNRQLAARRSMHTTEPSPKKAQVSITFVRANGERIPATGKVGDSILDVVVDSDVDLEGYGACEGTLTCSTCHVILKKQDFDKLPEKPTDEELDMLDLAHGLTDTSRLGCQITLTEDLDGLEIQVPATINDARK